MGMNNLMFVVDTLYEQAHKDIENLKKHLQELDESICEANDELYEGGTVDTVSYSKLVNERKKVEDLLHEKEVEADCLFVELMELQEEM